MLLDDGFRSPAAMLGRCRGRKMPFDIGCAGDKRNIVKVDNLEKKSGNILMRRDKIQTDFEPQLELGLGEWSAGNSMMYMTTYSTVLRNCSR